MRLTRAEAVVRCDYDADTPIPPAATRRARLRRAGFRIVQSRRVRSPSGRGWHLFVDVTPRPRTPETVVALQAILGSDPWREACNLARARVLHRVPRAMRRHWNVLYAAPRACG